MKLIRSKNYLKQINIKVIKWPSTVPIKLRRELIRDTTRELKHNRLTDLREEKQGNELKTTLNM